MSKLPSLSVNTCATLHFLACCSPSFWTSSELGLAILSCPLHSSFFARRTCSKPLECRRSYSRSLIAWIPAFLRQFLAITILWLKHCSFSWKLCQSQSSVMSCISDVLTLLMILGSANRSFPSFQGAIEMFSAT